ncbi:ABC transporter G family member 28-like [Papaver somniferum]|uniref:ABC transporter G family member 28-like n=1 Tax=Papaver somniferum TaxID=3469 RepID=UPI000E6F9639|nr:ABC transporter G family member 28-like [Papaver somniferum]
MVMEPSLLMLDEPTSGLDSSSSQLLLRALRREALEGVNICMVVHLPSYSLFKMFDDLILLAKGGLMVYNGPVKKVEQYFAGLGVIVPDRFCSVILKDLSERKTPGVFKQYRYYFGRVSKQRLRESKIQAVDFLILFLAGACLALLAKVSDKNFGLTGYTYTVIAVSLLCKIAALRSFSPDRLIYWRESSSGMSSLAYFLSKDTVDHFNTLVKPVVYLSMFYFFNDPRPSFMDYYTVLVSLVYCVTGIAYVFSIFLEPGAAQLSSVLLPVVLTLVSIQQPTKFVKLIANLCYPKWALQAFVISNARSYSGVWLLTRCASLMKTGYDIRNWNRSIIILFLYGAGSRILAYILMVTFRRK